jgi:biuret amidohydrolase
MAVTVLLAGGLRLDCMNAGFEVVVPRDAVAGVQPEDAKAVIDNTLRLVARAGRADDVLARWAQARQPEAGPA